MASASFRVSLSPLCTRAMRSRPSKASVSRKKCIRFDKRRLHRMHFFRLTDAFDGRDLIALVQSGESETRKLALAINVHRARTALPVIASLLRSSQVQMLAQAIEKSRARIDSQIVRFSVNREGNRDCIL